MSTNNFNLIFYDVDIFYVIESDQVVFELNPQSDYYG